MSESDLKVHLNTPCRKKFPLWDVSGWINWPLIINWKFHSEISKPSLAALPPHQSFLCSIFNCIFSVLVPQHQRLKLKIVESAISVQITSLVMKSAEFIWRHLAPSYLKHDIHLPLTDSLVGCHPLELFLAHKTISIQVKYSSEQQVEIMLKNIFSMCAMRAFKLSEDHVSIRPDI